MIINLKKLRTEKNLSQQALAEIIGVSQQSINKYENHDVEPDITVLIKMADLFNTSVDYLIGNTEVNHKIEKLEHHDLNETESNLVELFRKLNNNEKDSIMLIINNYLTKI